MVMKMKMIFSHLQRMIMIFLNVAIFRWRRLWQPRWLNQGNRCCLVRWRQISSSVGKRIGSYFHSYLKFQIDKAAKNIEVSSNSNSDKDNCPIQSDLVTPSSNTNLKLVDNLYIYHESENYDKAKNHVEEIFESSSTTKPS